MPRFRHTRRRFLAVTGAAAVAGCLGGDADGEGNGGGGGNGNASASADGAGTESDEAEDEPADADGTEPEVTDVTLLLNWQINGLHAPYVAAHEEGFYDEEGFESVDIESGDGSDFAANQAGLGNVEFAVSSPDQLLNVNSRGLSPQCVGVVMQRNPNVVFATRDGFGELTDPAQLEGATVGSGPGMVRQMTQAYLEHHGVLEAVEYVDSGFDTVQQLLSGEIDAAGGVFGDVVDAEHQDAEVDVLSIHEAIPSYGHLIATDEGFAANNGATVRAFLRATARGAVWATQNPEAAIDHLVAAQPELEEVRENQRDKWDRMHAEYMRSDAVAEHGWGWSESEPWQATYETLADGDVLEGEVDPETVWTNDYLDAEAESIGDYAESTDS
ncbi:ABC transporter substrate-binding protein [Halopiger aswanensis]|uniref:Thiamine pyrimidine synthase n=1 Tax=Halopiger aswanensis TaxID=148449 RepID=A0A3R7D9J6_9EURY|nr:ABC transporter substrate-binding protein [Halopiger aswanensis]RKD94843.1 NitT/TauT family transport system substrate-binding protein [Halopiger aswanensis]